MVPFCRYLVHGQFFTIWTIIKNGMGAPTSMPSSAPFCCKNHFPRGKPFCNFYRKEYAPMQGMGHTQSQGRSLPNTPRGKQKSRCGKLPAAAFVSTAQMPEQPPFQRHSSLLTSAPLLFCHFAKTKSISGSILYTKPRCPHDAALHGQPNRGTGLPKHKAADTGGIYTMRPLG